MAKNDANHGSSGEPSRVHKAFEVHKRRPQDRSVEKKVKPSDSGALPTQEDASDSALESASQGSASPEGASTDVALTELSSADEAVGEQSGGLHDDATGEAREESSDDTREEPSDEAPENPSEEDEAPEKPRKPLWIRVVGIVVGVILALLLVLTGFIAASRWLVFNDENDIQGKWYVYGTDVPLTFENGSIVINSDTSYAYHIDPTAKTIEYSFGNLAGHGRYWFNDGRKILVITDGNDYTMWSTLSEDLSYGVRCLLGNTDLPASDTSIVLTRTIVKTPQGTSAGANGASTESSESSSQSGSGDASGTSGESPDGKPSEMLMVSDIMMDEEEHE